MVKSKAKNNKKRQNANDAKSPQKRQRINNDSSDGTVPSTEQPPAPKKIIDLNDDCLQKIFGHLDLHSLFSVAVSNEYLRPAANSVYKRKFNNRIINFHGVDVHSNGYTNITNYFWVCFEKVSFSELKICLQFLRCFGSSLSNVHLYYHGSNSTRYDYIHQYLNEYCSANLLEIEFVIKPRLLIKHFDKPFAKVQTVTFHYCHFGEQFPFVSQWFPNARVLKLFNNHMDDRWTELPFHHLEHVRIDVNNGNKRDGFTRNEAAHLLDSCDQLKRLEIHMPSGRQGMTLNTLLNMIDGKAAIEVLALMMDKYCAAAKSTEIQRLVNEHPQLVELDLKNIKFTIDHAIDLMRQLNSLKIFRFQFNDLSEYAQFISRLDGEQWQPILRSWVLNKGPYYVSVNRKN